MLLFPSFQRRGQACLPQAGVVKLEKSKTMSSKNKIEQAKAEYDALMNTEEGRTLRYALSLLTCVGGDAKMTPSEWLIVCKDFQKNGIFPLGETLGDTFKRLKVGSHKD